MLSVKICVVCNDELTRISSARKTFIENQISLMRLLDGMATADPLIKVEMVDIAVVKQEPLDEISLSQPANAEAEYDEKPKSLIHTERFTIGEPTTSTIQKPKKPLKKLLDVPNDLFCPHCDKLYTRKSILRHHIAAVHSKILRFKCSMDGCEYACYQKGNLTIHQRNIHNVPGTKTYFCETCGAEYK